MKQVFRQEAGRRYFGTILVAVIMVAVLVMWADPKLGIGARIFFGAFFCFGLGAIASDFVSRLVAEDGMLRRYNWLNRRIFGVAIDNITSYDYDLRLGWILSAGDRKLRMPRMELAPFQYFLVHSVPRSLLHAKIWKGGLTPPEQEFKGLSCFDMSGWFTYMGVGVLCAVFFYFVSPSAAGTTLTFFLGRNIYDLHTIWGDISLTSEGLGESWPWRKRFIPWSEVRAIFRNYEASGSSFVVVGENGAIVIPSHLLKNKVAMRKLYCSFPKGTLFINFEARFRSPGGKRIVEKREAPEVQMLLEPQFS